MRYFWSLILVLALVTAGLFTLRVSRERGDLTPVSAAASAPSNPSPIAQRPVRPAPEADAPVPAPPVPVAENPVTQTPAAELPVAPAPVAPVQPDAVSEPVVPETAVVEAEAPAPAGPTSNFSLDELLGVVTQAKDQIREEAASQPVSEPAPAVAAADPMMEAAAAAVRTESPAAPAQTPAAAAPAGPSFEIRADGSMSVVGVGVIPGNGTVQRPFVLAWDTLRSVQREFNPRQGQSEVPQWLNALNGKRVRIEGNTLLPVVAQTTDELLVMQNPWDGCCLGVPPTPYDAIEVKLSRPQRMGNSPTGYGQVEGVFKIDPYIVSGWLLGLYMIEDAVFESGAGIVLPEI